ncbi:MAG TPA: hypothetical protein VFH58_03190 [Acidimicrobiales bacterium]|nr:hypothetical protein [Acidimicrobiales bacterium]
MQARPGTPRSLLSVLTGGGPVPDTDEGLAELMDRFNSLPPEERERLLIEAGLSPPAGGPWRRLTAGIDMPPAPAFSAEVEAAAGDVPVLQAFRAIREFLGDGRKLTPKGNLLVADARRLGRLLDDPAWPYLDEMGRDIRSADQLPRTQFLLRWARAAGAVRVQHGQMRATGSWGRLRPLEAVAKGAEALSRKGPLTLYHGEGSWNGALDQVMDEGLPHMLAVLWAVVGPLPYEVLLEGAGEVCDLMIKWSPEAAEWRHERYRWALDHMCEMLAEAGVLERRGELITSRRFGLVDRQGGELELTPLGRAVLGPVVTAAGYPVPEVGGWVDRPLVELLAQVPAWHPVRSQAEFDRWVQDHGPEEASEGLVSWVAGGYDDPQVPVAALHLAGRLGSPWDERAARGMLNSPAQGHAVGWLLDHGHDDVAADPGAMMRAGIEMLALTASTDDPGPFLSVIERVEDLDGFLVDCARVPGPSAERVLRTLAAVHPDPAVATAARRAAMSRGPVGEGRREGRPRNHRAVSRRRRRRH